MPLPAQWRGAVWLLLRRIRAEVPARLERAFLFGSRARGEARPDSDVDVLLVFERLPPDREPQAGMAEQIAAEVARRTAVPVEVWSVSMDDLQRGCRTPMLVDALADGIPLWPRGSAPLRVPFTSADSAASTAALLRRVEEGSVDVAEARRHGDYAGAVARARDDLVRLCTAALLLEGTTRPRRAEAVRAFSRLSGYDGLVARHGEVLRWAVASFGATGREELPVAPPPFGLRRLAAAIDDLQGEVWERLARSERGHFPCTPGFDERPD